VSFIQSYIDDNNRGLGRNHHKAIKLLKRSGSNIYAIFIAYLHKVTPSINNMQTYHEKKSNINIVESLE
jgi:hypothetical protein